MTSAIAPNPLAGMLRTAVQIIRNEILSSAGWQIAANGGIPPAAVNPGQLSKQRRRLISDIDEAATAIGFVAPPVGVRLEHAGMNPPAIALTNVIRACGQIVKWDQRIQRSVDEEVARQAEAAAEAADHTCQIDRQRISVIIRDMIIGEAAGLQKQIDAVIPAIRILAENMLPPPERPDLTAIQETDIECLVSGHANPERPNQPNHPEPQPAAEPAGPGS